MKTIRTINDHLKAGAALALLISAAVTGKGWGQSVSIAKTGSQPRVALARDGTVCVAFAQRDSLYCATSTNAGRSYAPPVKAGEVETLMCGMRRGPQIAATHDSLVITAIGRAGNIKVRRSGDGGQTWSDGGNVNDQHGSAREGLHAICAGAGDQVFAVWLDLRDGKTKLYGSLTEDGGMTWSSNMLVYASPDGSICECCQPSIASDRKGTFVCMWRNALDGNRDLWMATSTDGKRFGDPQKLGAGHWRLQQCPMDGGSIGVGAPGGVVSVWRRDKQVYRCLPGKKEVLLGNGSQPQVAWARDSACAAWEAAGQVLYAAPIGAEPKVIGAGKYPSLAADPQAPGPVIIVWEADGGVSGSVVN